MNNTINISETIINTINTMFQNLFSNIDNNIYSILDDITFINTDFFDNSYFEKILGNSSSGILLISNSILFGFALYYIIKLFLSNFTYIKISSPMQFIFKLIIISIFVNNSFFICEKIVYLFSLFSSSIRELGETLFNKNICFSQLVLDLNKTIYVESSSFNIFSFDGLLKSFISINLFNLVFSFSLRYIILKFLILIFPFLLISTLNNSLSFLFKSWLKLFFSLLSIQISVSILLLIMFSTNYESSNLLSKFIYLGSILAITKVNYFTSQFFGSPNIESSFNVSNISSIFKKT